MAIRSVLVPIQYKPGIVTDTTDSDTDHWIYAEKIRFENGRPKKIGGWVSVNFDNDETISGYTRTIFTDYIDGTYYVVLGTHLRLHSVIGTDLNNITPLDTTTNAIADSLDTHYDTLGADPLAATDGSATVTVTDADAANYAAGDTITLSGASTFAGIDAGDLNTVHIIRSIGSGTYTIIVGSSATSTASGGGASVVRSSGLITVNATAHGQVEGDKTKLAGAATTGGITDAQINLEFIIRNVAADTFDIMTAGTATSAVTGGGGASTTYQKQIAAGLQDETAVTGYGAGLYGVGIYGTALVSSSARNFPRIWFLDRYGNTIVGTAGNQTGVYQWAGANATAPVLISNAPTEVNYAFISNNILVTFGAGGTENRIFASDQNDLTQWTSSSTNQVYDDDLEGASRLLSHVPVEDYSLIFSEFKTYTFRYIGLPFVWEVKTLDENIGIIAPMARISVKGVAYWMGRENFYMFRGGTVDLIPGSDSEQCPCLRYVFDDLNYGQKSKIFAWYNKQYNEMWVHYPSEGSNECDRVIRVNLSTYEWAIDLFDRTAAEYPTVKQKLPLLANNTTLYRHETGHNADGAAMAWTLRGPRKARDKRTTTITSIIPDSDQTGDITLNVKGYLYPQSTATSYDEDYTISPTTEDVATLVNARFYQYELSGSVLAQNWKMGAWYEEAQQGTSE